MARKRITQVFPWLLPLRKKQRKLFFYWKMKHDGHRYAETQVDHLFPHMLFQSACPMYNPNTGFDMVYQENKVFNLRLAAVCLDKLIIRPGETFSFWQRVRHADRHTPYKDALAEVDGKLVAQQGGGLCQISNLFCWMFLHTPLTIIERNGHAIKAFPEPPSDAPMGVDATVSEGWLDLRVRNDTDETFQITLSFDAKCIIGSILTKEDAGVAYQVFNGEPLYYRKASVVFEEVDVLQHTIETTTQECISSRVLYRNKCEIGYPLSDDKTIMEEEPDEQNQCSSSIWRTFARI